jgi:hemerythrin-like metal-binding protein
MTSKAPACATAAHLSLGFEPMDAVHRDFQDLLSALSEPGDQGEKLLALHEHLLHHCAQEERWMRETDFATAAMHVREHEMLLEVVSEARRRFDAGDSDIVVRLAHDLPLWFDTHAETMDAPLSRHLGAIAVADVVTA